jgi:hypothetical protein
VESVFIVNKFDNGWDMEELAQDIYAQEEYCIEALDIPDEKIYGTEMIAEGMLEIVLTGIQKCELSEDWYINLNRVSA